jgi:hypothetical protein
MAQEGEVPFQLMILLNNHVLMYAYLFLCKIGTNVGVDILISKKVLALIECPNSVFPKDQQLYKHVRNYKTSNLH